MRAASPGSLLPFGSVRGAPDWRRIPWELTYRRGARVASVTRRLIISATHLHCSVIFRGPVHIGPGFSLYIPDSGTLDIGPGVEFRRGFHCEIRGKGRVRIGADSVFTSNALIQCTTSIDIGERCAFGQALLIVDGNHRFRDLSVPMQAQGYDFRPITIGDDVTVTTKCTIVANLGERAVIGANTVVTRDIPPFCVAVGAPARVVEYFGPPELRPPGLEH